MTKELIAGVKIGRGSLVITQKNLKTSLGEWATILPHLDHLSSISELELVAAINYFLGKDLRLTPTLKAALARDFVTSGHKLVVSDSEFLLELSSVKDEKGDNS